MSSPLLTLLRLVPQHFVSRLAGRAAALPLPRPLRRPLVGAFGRTFGVDFGEVVGPLDSYASIQDFFTRALPPGGREVDAAADAVVAPCDGRWGSCGSVADGELLQVKGRPYSLAALLGSVADARAFEGGAYATFYLAPRNYHRFHSPCDGRVVRARYLPGALWPVNRVGVEGIPALFASNERLCAFLEVGAASAPLCLVAVGATMVGKVRVNFDDLTTNEGGRAPVERDYRPAGHRLAKGEEWGRFEFGSTIVLVAGREAMEVDCCPPGTELRLGRRIGRLR
jgi:phosphatidylserine decarboxylase